MRWERLLSFTTCLLLGLLVFSQTAMAQFDTDPLETYRKQNKQHAEETARQVDKALERHPSRLLEDKPEAREPSPDQTTKAPTDSTRSITIPVAPSSKKANQPPLLRQGLVRLFLDIKASSIFWLLLGIPIALLIRGQFRLEEED